MVVVEEAEVVKPDLAVIGEASANSLPEIEPSRDVSAFS